MYNNGRMCITWGIRVLRWAYVYHDGHMLYYDGRMCIMMDICVLQEAYVYYERHTCIIMFNTSMHVVVPPSTTMWL